MRTTTSAALAAALLSAIALPIAPASATTTSQALTLCVARGTDCKAENKDGGTRFCVNNNGKQQCVQCPPLTSNGDCNVAKIGITNKSKVNAIKDRPMMKAR